MKLGLCYVLETTDTNAVRRDGPRRRDLDRGPLSTLNCIVSTPLPYFLQVLLNCVLLLLPKALRVSPSIDASVATDLSTFFQTPPTFSSSTVTNTRRAIQSVPPLAHHVRDDLAARLIDRSSHRRTPSQDHTRCHFRRNEHQISFYTPQRPDRRQRS